MAKIAVELTNLGSMAEYNLQTDPYTSSAVGLGPAMMQSSGSGVNNWVGPILPAVIRPFEYTTSTIATYPWAMTWPSSSIDWVFWADNLTAAATRKVMFSTFNRTNGAFAIQGVISVTFPVATNITVRGFGMEYKLHTTGSISGTSGSWGITGSGTNFGPDGACIGNRIGFGTTIPSQVTQWYEITGSGFTSSSVTFFNSCSLRKDLLLLTTPLAQTYTNTPYVIEDLRATMITTNATTANGGVFVVKGLRPECFNALGTGVAAIPAAATLDSTRACYWLADAATVQNTASFGHAFDNGQYHSYSFATHSMWVADGPANFPSLYLYNTRRPLFLTAGKDTGSLMLRTGPGGAFSGTPSQADNLILATTNHGPGAGLPCLYFTTTTKVYRTAAIGTIVSGSTVWLSGGDIMAEVPPGSANAFAASSLMNTIEYSNLTDRFLIGVNSTTTPFRSYLTQYNAYSNQMDRVWGIDTRQIDQAAAPAALSPVPSYTGTNWSPNTNNGITYLGSTNSGAGSAVLTRGYAVPLTADWEYAAQSGCRIILPAINTPNCNYYSRVYVNTLGTAGTTGGNTGQNLAVSAEDYRIYYRTTGINDNSGGWTLVDKAGNLSGIAGAAQIQFMAEFRTIGTTMVADRIISLSVIYQDTATDTHYQPSVAFTNLSTKTFAWRFANAWGSTVPTLKVTITDAVTGAVLVTDLTSGSTGTWAKSTNNGSSFGAYDTNDLTNTGSYITYVPASLGDNIKVQANLTQY